MIKFNVAGHAPSFLPDGYDFKLVWSDEFDGDTLDESKWDYRLSMMGKRHNAWTDKGVRLENSCAVFSIFEDGENIVSSQLQTGYNFMDVPVVPTKFGSDHLKWPIGKLKENKFTHKYGYYECYCKLQQLAGWWSAFWIQSPIIGASLDPKLTGAEVDVMECFTPDGVVIEHNAFAGGYGLDMSCHSIGGAVADVKMPFINQLFKAGIAEYIDGFSYHAYNFDDSSLRARITALRGLLDLYNLEIEIIQGESGTPSNPYGFGALHEGGWTPRKQCKTLLRHLITDLGMGVKFTSHFSYMDMMEALNGVEGDKASYKDFGYFGVLSATFDENGIATGGYSPKPSYYALSCLASILEGDIKAMPLPILAEKDIADHCGKIPTLKNRDVESYGLRLDNGSYAYAHWHPINYMTTEFEGAVTFQCADLGEVHLVDPMDGTVYEIPAELVTCDEFGSTWLRLLPIKDYPLILVFGEIK